MDPEKTIPFPWLVELILNYKMQQHVSFLAVFREKFRKFDTANQGVIGASFVSQFLRTVDPYRRFDHQWVIREVSQRGRARVNFSDAVVAFSGAPALDPEAPPESPIEALNGGESGRKV